MHRHAHDAEASRAFLRWIYPRLVAEHAYMTGPRDPAGIGLPVVVHPWESGLDNSPVWDRDLSEMEIPAGAVPPYVRHDLAHGDPKDRPTNAAYDRFVYLAASYRDSGYDDARIAETVPFVMASPLFASILLWSTHALAEIAAIVGEDPTPHREAAARLQKAMLTELWDPEQRRFSALDVIRRERSAEDTVVSLAPLLDPELPREQVEAIVADLHSASFHPEAKLSFVVPSYDLLGEGFDARRYWRGPVWINTNWLLAAGLRQHGYHSLVEQIVSSSLRLVAGAGFREYFNPFDGTGYGTDGFGWSAALTIDFIERQPPIGARSTRGAAARGDSRIRAESLTNVPPALQTLDWSAHMRIAVPDDPCRISRAVRGVRVRGRRRHHRHDVAAHLPRDAVAPALGDRPGRTLRELHDHLQRRRNVQCDRRTATR